MERLAEIRSFRHPGFLEKSGLLGVDGYIPGEG
jgi:hypothetical protein